MERDEREGRQPHTPLSPSASAAGRMLTAERGPQGGTGGRGPGMDDAVMGASARRLRVSSPRDMISVCKIAVVLMSFRIRWSCRDCDVGVFQSVLGFRSLL